MTAPIYTGYQQSLSYSAAKDRHVVHGAMGRRATANALSGVIPQAQAGLSCSASGFSLTATAGVATIAGYWFIHNGNTSLTVEPTTGAARRDLLIARVYDIEAGDASSEGRLEIVKGTNTSDPVIPPNSLLLYQIDVPASGSSVTLVDRRVFAVAAGAVKPVQKIADIVVADEIQGAPIYDRTTDILWRRSGAALKRIGSEVIANGIINNNTTVEVRNSWHKPELGPINIPSAASSVLITGTFTLNIIQDGATDLVGAFNNAEVFHPVLTHHSAAPDTERTYSWTGVAKNIAAGSYSGCYLGLMSGAGAIIHVKNLAYSWVAFG